MNSPPSSTDGSLSAAAPGGRPGTVLVGLSAALLHSLSQIFFHTTWPTGLLILAAFAAQDWTMALLALLGAAASTAGAALQRVPTTRLKAGTQGFCGALVGAAAFSALGTGWEAVVASLAGGVLCAPVTLTLSWLFSSPVLRRFALPTTTAPFCIVAGLMLVFTRPLQQAAAPFAAPEGGSAVRFVHATLTNVSQVVLVDSSLAGLLILGGLFLAHWKAGLAGLLGSVLEVSISLALNAPQGLIYHGMEGYSGVLTAVALASVFLVGTWQPWVAALVGVLLSVLVGRALGATGIPVYTWPYVVATWIVLIAAAFIPRLRVDV